MDRLSCLPDEVICHILSFLGETKLSVRTSVLSKRWRFIWAHVPSLQFSFGYGVNEIQIVNFITKIVLQHEHDLHTFCLSIRDLGDFGDDIEETVQSWIVNITTRNIRNLTISLRGYMIELPHCLFTCKTLVDLFLNGVRGIPQSGIYFPALKKLKLVFVGFESQESLGHLISGCPVLEDLSTENPSNLVHYCVSSSTLTRLELESSQREIVKIDTPALRYLWLGWCMPDELSVGALDSLIEADLTLSRGTARQGNIIYSHSVLAFVGKLYNVKVLTLKTDWRGMIYDSGFSSLAVKLHNLTKLDLTSNLGFISFFLENADNLQVLEFMIHDMVDVDNQYGWMEPKHVPACLISNLQTVVARCFRCSEHEFEMVRYISMNAKVLKVMEIRTSLKESDCKKKLEAHKRLKSFERGSQECQLLFK